MYKSILSIVTGFFVLSEVFHLKQLTLIAIVIAVLALISSFIGDKIVLIWEKIGGLLSKIVPNILLGVIYYFFLFPMALLKRLTSKSNPLFLKNTETSYFISNSKEFNKSNLKKTW